MLVLINILLIIFYVSLLVELIWFSVPSPASTIQMHKQPSQSIVWLIVSILGVLAYIIPIIYVICIFFNIRFFEINSSKLLLILGSVLLILGRIITFAGGVQIKNHLKQNRNVVLDSGIFKFSRHPIALGLIVALTGLNFILPSFVMIFLSVIFVFDLHKKVLFEETILFTQYAETYENYCKKTRRYF